MKKAYKRNAGRGENHITCNRKGIDISNICDRRIVKGLGYYKTKQVNDLRELVKGTLDSDSKNIGFKFKDKNGQIMGKTYEEFNEEIDSLGTALVSLGLKDAHISIISENRYEWGVCYYSITNGTGTAVPMDKYLPEREVENLIERGKVDAIFYSLPFHEIMVKISNKNNRIKYFICIDEILDKETGSPEPIKVNSTLQKYKFITMSSLIKKGRDLLRSGNRDFIDATINPKKMSILLFTSGTTSISKGVMLSHSNIVSNVLSIAETIKTYPTDVHLSILPLHHTFENTVGLSFMIYSKVCIAYCEGIRHIGENIQEYKVTLLVVVPAILEAMYRRVEAGIKASGKTRAVAVLGWISQALFTLGIDVRRKLFKSILEKLGPGLRLAVSGAAPLNPDVVRKFQKMGLRLLQGYGLTETSPVVAANNDFINIPGSIGHPLSEVEVTIDKPDENGMGEIFTRGKNVMLGYYEDPVATKESIDEEGWFKTGDLGTIDKKGIIRITGRAKSMIVLTNGKKAFPEEYEVLLDGIPGVKESFVWGNKAEDGDIQVCAKLVIDPEGLINSEELTGHGVQPKTNNETSGKLNGEDLEKFSEKEIKEYFAAKIKEINKTIPAYKTIRYFIMTYEDLEKTTTLKIKRSVEYEKTIGTLNNMGLEIRKLNGILIDRIRKP